MNRFEMIATGQEKRLAGTKKQAKLEAARAFAATGHGDGLKSSLDALPFAAVLVEPDGRIIRTNPLFDRQWGDCSAEQDRRTLGELVLAEDIAKLADAIAAFTRHESSEAVSMELRFTGADAPRRAQVGLAPWREGETETPLFLLQIVPLAEQAAREAALAELEERWRHALSASKLGVWDADLRTGKFNFSDLWLQIRGYGPQDRLYHYEDDWVQRVHPDDREQTLLAVERQNSGDPDYAVFRYRLRNKQGEWIWIECRGRCVEWDENGVPVRATGTDADVTSRKDWEDNMTTMSRRLQLALEVSRIGVFEANLTTGLTSWDERMYAIYDLPHDTKVLVGTVWENMLHPEDRQRVIDKVNHHRRTLTPFSDEFRVIRKNGLIATIRSRGLPFVESATGHRKIVGANWDVTEDVELQKQLRQARDLAEAHNIELEKARARIEHNALHDHLTGLPNRRYLDQILDEADAVGDLAILHIDLDRFKQINDTQGHSVGDVMLKYAAGILSNNVRAGDFIARIGGDEFVVIVRSGTQHGQLKALAGRIIDQLRKPVLVENHACRIGASIGIAARHDEVLSARQLLQNADIALYRAKNLGRNRSEIFSCGMQHEIVNTKRISDEILQALEHNEFIPYYQLQFDARTLEVSGAETLARWRHPREGILAPDRFLAIAEDLDAVSAIDAHILDRALIDFRQWQAMGLPLPKFSVNVSARRLHDPMLHSSVRQLGITPGTVSFELLESVFLDNYDAVVSENLDNLRALGIDIEIDDFGSGHASIVSLVRLAPSTLKIDRELVQPLVNSPEQRKLVGSIIEIGRSLNIRVVAEGVETADHIRILRDLGCDLLQGYALSRPMPGHEVADFVRSQRWRANLS